MQSKNLVKNIIVSEKAERIKPQNKYVFSVDKSANKNELKKIFKKELNVDVIAVNIVKHKNDKKAIITLKPGQTINEKV